MEKVGKVPLNVTTVLPHLQLFVDHNNETWSHHHDFVMKTSLKTATFTKKTSQEA